MRDAVICLRNGPNAAPRLASLGDEVVIRIDHQKCRDLLVVGFNPFGRTRHDRDFLRKLAHRTLHLDGDIHHL